MKAQTTRESLKAGLRNMILDGARELFEQAGYEEFSMRKLGAKIEYSPASIYLHFKNKEELFLAIVDQSFERFTQSQSALDQEIDDPIEGLKAGLRSYVEFGLKNPNEYRFAFLLQRPDGSLPNSQPAYDRLKRRVAACIKQGNLSRKDINLTTQSLWCAVHGVTSLLIQRPSFPWVQKRKLISHVIKSAISMLVREKHKNAKV